MAVVRGRAEEAGFSARVASFISQSRRESTRSVYDAKLDIFKAWCEEKGVDFKSASIPSIADFLLSLFDRGRAVSTIRGYRSAISAVHEGFPDGSSVSDSQDLGKLLKSFFLARPRNPQLTPSWSLPKVLDALAKPPFEPLAKASLLHLTVKTVFLVAVASSQRCSTLNALRVSPGHLRFDRLGVRLVPSPSFIAKNQTASSGSIEICLSPLARFSSVREDKVWCPVRALKYYLDRTKDRRSGEHLFIITQDPFSGASSQTIARWIVQAIRSAGAEALTDDRRPHAHDTRGISASWALFNGAPTSDIMRAAFWSTPNTFISYYLRDIPSS